MEKENATEKLASIIKKIENIDSDIKERQQEKTAVYDMAKNEGFNISAIKKIIKDRKMDTEKRIELKKIVEIYEEKLNMF